MPTLLLITGTCGVGKSTTAAAWAAARRGAAISGDEIRLWIRHKETRYANEYQQDAVARIAAAAAEAFIELGLDVAADFVWKPQTLRYLAERLRGKADVRMVWLRCERTENRRRDAERSADVVMGDRVDELLSELTAITDWPAELRRLDTTNLSLEEVLQALT